MDPLEQQSRKSVERPAQEDKEKIQALLDRGNSPQDIADLVNEERVTLSSPSVRVGDFNLINFNALAIELGISLDNLPRSPQEQRDIILDAALPTRPSGWKLSDLG